MKKIMKYIIVNIPMLILFVTGVCGQGEQLPRKGNENIVKLPSIITCGNYPASGTFIKAISTIITAKECVTVITPGLTVVHFIAHDKIILSPGFIAQSGSNFVAHIDSSQQLITDASNEFATAEKMNTNVFAAPNPFKMSFTLSINAQKDERAQVTIYNSFGVKVNQQTGINLSKGRNNLTFHCSNFANGVYMIEINFGHFKIVKKVIKV